MAEKAAKKNMSKAEIVTAMSQITEMTKKDVVKFFDSFAELAYKEAKKRGKFLVPGIGFLKLMKRKAREARNPATGEKIKVPAKTVVKFGVSKGCKEAIVPPVKKK